MYVHYALAIQRWKLKENRSRRERSTRQDSLLYVPSSRTNAGKRCFHRRAPVLYNSLPPELTELSTKRFSRAIIKHITSRRVWCNVTGNKCPRECRVNVLCPSNPCIFVCTIVHVLTLGIIATPFCGPPKDVNTYIHTYIHQNSDCIISHHQGEWKTILQFGEKSGILLLLGHRFSPRFHNPRTLVKIPGQHSETKTIARKRAYHYIENESSWCIIRDLE